LQKVIPPEFYEIEKIVKEKGRGHSKKYLVKWKGYHKSANSWISQSQMK